MFKNSKILFIVQGEGRGHLTQAIAMREILLTAGYKNICTLVGISQFRKTPSFFYDKMDNQIREYISPNFIRDKKNRSLRIFISLLINVFKCRQYFKSLKIIHKNVKEFKPDLILNFYEPLTGLYYIIYKPKVPIISIAHQYFYQHPEFECPKGGINKFFLKLLTKITCKGSIKKLAIHIEQKSNYYKKKIFIIPPLIRSDVLNQSVANNGHFCIYLLNRGYSNNIIDWHNKNKNVHLHCFWDNQSAGKIYMYDKTLTFYQIDDQIFTESLSSSDGLLTTAGYESVCEAMYFGKPVLMVPVGNHFEQYVNSIVFQKAGAGISASYFDIDKFVAYKNDFRVNEGFKEWIKKAPEIIIDIIDKTFAKQD